MDMVQLAFILNNRLPDFQESIIRILGNENGQKVLRGIIKSISDNIQLKLEDLLEE